jgi:hypothetical protein
LFTAQEIEIAIAKHFNYRQNLIVPNVSHGLDLLWEADMLILRPSGYLTEIEIKVSKYDLLNDEKKAKWRMWPWRRIAMHYYAVPEDLVPFVPNQQSGIIKVRALKDDVVTRNCYKKVKAVYKKGEIWTELVRSAKLSPLREKLSPARRLKLAELGAMRIWDLKQALARHSRSSRKDGCGEIRTQS